MTGIELAAGLAVLAGALLQSAVGFGFSLVCAPLVFAAAATPEHAVWLLLALGLEVNLLTAGTEGRRVQPLWSDLGRLLAWALPGTVVGVIVLRAADARLLQVLVTVSVFAGLAARHVAAQRAQATQLADGETRAPRWWAPPAAGVSSGALATSVSASGPPIVLYLIGRGIAPARVRDTLTMYFMGVALIGSAVLAIGGAGAGGRLPSAAPFAALGALVVLGHLLGRPVFALLAERHYERVLTGVLVVSAISGLLVALI